MRRWTSAAFVAIGALILTSVPAGAKEKPQQAAALQAKREQEKKAAALLNGTIWTVEITPLSGQKGKKPFQDTLTFDGGKITSRALSKEGYPTSNYTLTVGEDGMVVWETMQTKEGAGVAFWRGERQGDAMRGILSKQPLEGNNVDYSFSGKVTGTAAPAPAAVAPPVTDAAPQPSTTGVSPGVEPPTTPPPPPAEPKKKRGWW